MISRLNPGDMAGPALGYGVLEKGVISAAIAGLISNILESFDEEESVDAISSADPGTSTDGSGEKLPPTSLGNVTSPELPKKPNLERKNDQFFKNHGIEDIESFKEDYYTRRHGNSDLHVNKDNGEIYVVPRRADGGYLYEQAIPTGEFAK